MAKTLKDFLEGYLKVKSADEQKFIDKHVTAKNPDRNGNGDDVFKGSTKAIDRRKERKGYNPGEDEKVYEAVCAYDKDDKIVGRYKDMQTAKKLKPGHRYVKEELKGGQKNLDKNHNGKLDSQDFKMLRSKKKVAEEAEQIDEDKNLHWMDNEDKGSEAKKRTPVQHKARYKKLVKDAEQFEKHSAIHSYAKNRAQAYKNYHNVNEEAEQIDELSAELATRAGDKADDRLIKMRKARKFGSWPSAAETKSSNQVRKFDSYANKKQNTMEEIEDLDESAKIAAHLIKRYGDNVRKSHVMSAAKDFGVDPSKLAKMVRTKLGKTTLGEEQIDEVSAATKDSYAQRAGKQLSDLFKKSGKSADDARKYYNRKNTVRKIANEAVEEIDEKLSAKSPMGTYIKDFEKSDAPRFKGKSPAKRRVMAIAAKLTAERGGKPLNKEERLQARLGDISESHQRVMLEVFEKLNEDNKSKFLQACDTPDGVDQMLDFAINNRGE